MKWDDEVDVAVLGFGAAGAAATLTAMRRGASVLLIEKQPEDRHTPNVRMSGGLFMTVNDAKKGAQYLNTCAGGMVPEAPIRALAERATSLLDWVRAACPDLQFSHVNKAEQPHLPGAEAIDVYQPGRPRFKQDPAAGSGRELFASLAKTVRATGARIAWGSAAKQLLRGEHGEIVGVAIDSGGGLRNIRARNGVILTTGGFEFDEDAKLSFLRSYPMHFYGNPGNTGDGLRMAQEVGAGLWHMNQMVGRAVGHFKRDDGTSLVFFISINPPGYVILDQFGQRFANENAQALLQHSFYFDLIHFDSHLGIYPRNPCYWFFDERRRKAGPLTYTHIGACAVGMYDWSEDNSREIEQGWIHRGATIEEAATKAGVKDPAAAARTVAQYNAGCQERRDAFGRSSDSLVPIEEPPFYCVQLVPGGSNTTGGPKRDEYARVLDVNGKPILGLYAAGELGQVSGLLYPADGGNLCEAFCFGQIAAESALQRNVS
jgi:succinate dehydrogenase/fumarate reductase flavoprotein subunit